MVTEKARFLPARASSSVSVSVRLLLPLTSWPSFLSAKLCTRTWPFASAVTSTGFIAAEARQQITTKTSVSEQRQSLPHNPTSWFVGRTIGTIKPRTSDGSTVRKGLREDGISERVVDHDRPLLADQPVQRHCPEFLVARAARERQRTRPHNGSVAVQCYPPRQAARQAVSALRNNLRMAGCDGRAWKRCPSGTNPPHHNRFSVRKPQARYRKHTHTFTFRPS